MTTHLSSQEFVNALDEGLPEVRQAHLSACAPCRENVEGLRALMAEVAGAEDVHEPSPLFWDHFQARVQTVVAAETAAPLRMSFWSSLSSGLGSARTALAAAATVAVVVLAVALYQRDEAIPVSTVAVTDAVVSDTMASAESAASLDGAEWEFMSGMMGTLERDDARDVLVPSRHAVDAAFETLNTVERDAFIKLMKAELAQGVE